MLLGIKGLEGYMKNNILITKDDWNLSSSLSFVALPVSVTEIFRARIFWMISKLF